MRQLYVLCCVLGFFFIQSCQSVPFTSVKTGTEIPNEVQQALTPLNQQLVQAIFQRDEQALLGICSDSVKKLHTANIASMMEQLQAVELSKAYEILQTYYGKQMINGLPVQFHYTSEKNEPFHIRYQAPTQSFYTSLILLPGKQIDVLLVATYGKYQNRWKLSSMIYTAYRIMGKSASDYLNQSKQYYNQGHAIDAALQAYIAQGMITQPTEGMLQYEHASTITTHLEEISEQLDRQYTFPMVMYPVDAEPELFSIVPQLTGAWAGTPIVTYRTHLHFEDSAKIHKENLEVREYLYNTFLGFDQHKQYVMYQVVRNSPNLEPDQDSYTFVDTLHTATP